MGGYSPSRDSGSADAPTTKKSKVTKTKGQGGLVDFIKGGGFTGAIIRAASKGITAVKKDLKNRRINQTLLGSSDYQGGKTFSSSKVNFGGGNGEDGRKNNPQGIELAKASTTSATIKGPEQIQKEAANKISGPTTTEMSADQITLANKRKGRRTTNITAKKTLDKNYTLSKKTLLG